jgi:hypothetical protein
VAIAAMNVKRQRFNEQDDKQLLRLVETFGTNWSTISNFMPKYNERQCKDRFTYFLDPRIRKDPWTQEEDDRLIEKVAQYKKQWIKLVQFFEGRTESQLKNRYRLLISRNSLYQANDYSRPLIMPADDDILFFDEVVKSDIDDWNLFK